MVIKVAYGLSSCRSFSKRDEKAKWNLQAPGSSESISITANPADRDPRVTAQYHSGNITDKDSKD
jgi:hypothetical protein